jgi:hypothetical protein
LGKYPISNKEYPISKERPRAIHTGIAEGCVKSGKGSPLEIGFECWILDIERSLTGSTFSDRTNGIQSKEQIVE